MTTSLAPAVLLVLSLGATAADTQLTVYSGDFDAVSANPPGQGMGGFALVRETRAFDLSDGDTTLTWSGLPSAIDAASVRFSPRSDAVAVNQQRFDFALADQSELLRRALGQRVTVEQINGETRQSWSGVLMAAGDGVTLRLDDGRVRVLPHYSAFELATMPEGLYAQPTLRWGVRSARAGDETFVLDYATAGLAWRAEYLATLRGTGTDCRMDFAGAAQVLNRSGASFAAAQLSLVAGEPNLARSPPPQRLTLMQKHMEAADAAPTPQASGEYHAYRLPGRIDLPDGSVQRVPLLPDASAVACVRRYETQSPMGVFTPPTPIVQPEFGETGMQPVQAMLEFTNRKQDGLGVPLPAGRLRAFERGAAGEENFLGESVLDHTAAGREVRAALGESFDLSAERKRENFAVDLDGRTMTEEFSLTLRNAKPSAVTVRAIEVLPRWSDWEVVQSSKQWTKRDSQRLSFDVPVPAQGEAIVRYTVRYRWPESIKP